MTEINSQEDKALHQNMMDENVNNTEEREIMIGPERHRRHLKNKKSVELKCNRLLRAKVTIAKEY